MIYVAAIEYKNDRLSFVIFLHTVKDDIYKSGAPSNPEFKIHGLNGIEYKNNKWVNIHDAIYSGIQESVMFPNKNSAQRALLEMVFN